MAPSPGRRGRILGQHLGATALADALDQGSPFGTLLGRGVGGSTGMGVASLMSTAYWAIQSSPQPVPYNCAGTIAVPDHLVAAKRRWAQLRVLQLL